MTTKILSDFLPSRYIIKFDAGFVSTSALFAVRFLLQARPIVAPLDYFLPLRQA